jgi:hypothetical protein
MREQKEVLKDCKFELADYFECLHSKKEYARVSKIRVKEQIEKDMEENS